MEAEVTGVVPKIDNLAHLRAIASSLFRLDIWALDTSKRVPPPDPGPGIVRPWRSMFRTNAEDIRDLLDDELVSLMHDGEDDLYESFSSARFRAYADSLSEDRLLGCVLDLRTSEWYTRLVRLRVIHYRLAKSEQAYAKNTGPQSIAKLEIDAHHSRLKLKAVVKESVSLRNRIKSAAENGDVNGLTLERLKRKMEALQEYFPEACNELGVSYQPLVDSDLVEGWW